MGAREDVVRAHWRDLLPTAYLLTGDQGTARQLVVRTLARRRPVPVDRDGGVAALVGRHRSRWRITGRGAISGTPAAPWWSSAEDTATALQLAADLEGLDRDERTAVVLRWFEDWTPEQVAHLVPGADPDAAARRLPLDPADLPHRLEGLAALCDLGTLDDAQVGAAVRETARVGTRRAVLAVLAVAAVVAAGIWIPRTLPDPRDRADVAASPTRSTAAVPLRGIFALPPRGDLVGDDELLDGLRGRLVVEGLPGEDYRLLYGDDVEGVRVVLMIRAAVSRMELAWLTGPAGAQAADLAVVQADDSGPDGTIGAAVAVPGPDGGGIRLVVLTEDGNDVTVSPGVDVDPATGAAARVERAVPAPGGIAAVTLDRSSDAAVRYVLSRRDHVLAGDLRPASTAWFPFPGEDGPPRPSRSGNPTASALGYDAAVSTITTATGWAADDLDVVVLGAGTVPAEEWDPVEVVSVAARLPGGAVVTTTGISSSSMAADGTGASFWGGCGSSTYPAGTDLADLVVAASCSVPSTGPGAGDRLTVVAAPPGSRVVLDSSTGGTPVEPELVAGFGFTTHLGAQDLSTATDGRRTFPVAGLGADVLQP